MAEGAAGGVPPLEWRCLDCGYLLEHEVHQQRPGGQESPALLIPCCEHCGCDGPRRREGHDDTCSHGCNDGLVSAVGGQESPAEVRGSYCAGFDEGRCTCDDPEVLDA